MTKECEACPHARIHGLEYRVLGEGLSNLKERVGRLETTLRRGVMLLVVNLVAVIVTLAQGFLQP